MVELKSVSELKGNILAMRHLLVVVLEIIGRDGTNIGDIDLGQIVYIHTYIPECCSNEGYWSTVALTWNKSHSKYSRCQFVNLVSKRPCNFCFPIPQRTMSQHIISLEQKCMTALLALNFREIWMKTLNLEREVLLYTFLCGSISDTSSLFPIMADVELVVSHELNHVHYISKPFTWFALCCNLLCLESHRVSHHFVFFWFILLTRWLSDERPFPVKQPRRI